MFKIIPNINLLQKILCTRIIKYYFIYLINYIMILYLSAITYYNIRFKLLHIYVRNIIVIRLGILSVQ